MNLANIPLGRALDMILSNKIIFGYAVRTAEKSVRTVEKYVRSKMNGATHMKIQSGSNSILFTDGATHWKTPQDEVWGDVGKMVRGFIEPIIVKMTNRADGMPVSILVDNSGDSLKVACMIGGKVFADGTIAEIFDRFKAEIGEGNIEREMTAMLGDGSGAVGFGEGEHTGDVEDAEFEELPETVDEEE